jgi:hypothetical protein
VETRRALWDRPLVLGLGRRVDSFWYPAQADEQIATRENQ